MRSRIVAIDAPKSMFGAAAALGLQAAPWGEDYPDHRVACSCHSPQMPTRIGK
jgi:hypothetical protein